MQTHTQEPWSIGGKGSEKSIYAIINGERQIIADAMGEATSNETDFANSARIVACVNALQDVENPEEWRTIQIERIQEIVEVKQQRNILLDTLRSISDAFESGEIGQVHYDKCANLVEEFKAIETKLF